MDKDKEVTITLNGNAHTMTWISFADPYSEEYATDIYLEVKKEEHRMKFGTEPPETVEKIIYNRKNMVIRVLERFGYALDFNTPKRKLKRDNRPNNRFEKTWYDRQQDKLRRMHHGRV